MEPSRSLTRKLLPRSGPLTAARPRLTAAIGAALQQRSFVLLSAPAGYGKTTALLHALRSLPDAVEVAWVRVLPGEGLAGMLQRIVEALDPLDAAWHVSPQALPALACEPAGPRRVADELRRALEGIEAHHLVLAFDDLDAIADPLAFQVLAAMLAELPPEVTVAATCRLDPPLPVARMLLEDRAAEFRQADLAFGLEDVERMMASVGDAAPGERPGHPTTAGGAALDAAQLLALTGGWPAAVQLMLQGAGRGRSSGQAVPGRRWIYSYLADEVFSALDAGMKDFLLSISELDEVTARSAAALHGCSMVQAEGWISLLLARQLFVLASAEPEPTVRLHDLFREFLQQQLLQQAPERHATLMLTAARLERDPERRLSKLIKANAVEEGLQQLLQRVSIDGPPHDPALVLRLAALIPEPWRSERPEVAMARGICAWQGLRHRGLVTQMQMAYRGFEQRGQAALAALAAAYVCAGQLLAGNIEVARQQLDVSQVVPRGRDAADDLTQPETTCVRLVTRYWFTLLEGPPEATAACMRELLDHLDRHGRAQLHFRCLPAFAMWDMERPGMWPLMQRFARAAYDIAGDNHDLLRIGALFLMGGGYYLRGQLRLSHPLFMQAAHDNRWMAGSPLSARLVAGKALSDLMKGDSAGCRKACRSFVEIAEKESEPRPATLRSHLGHVALVAAANEDWTLVRQLLRDIEADAPVAEGPMWRVDARAVRARLDLHEGRAQEAADQLRAVVTANQRADRGGLDVYARISLAVALLRLGDAQEAWQWLEPTVVRLSEVGHWTAVWRAGHGFLQELAAAPWPGTARPEHVAQVREWLTRNDALRQVQTPADFELPDASERGVPADGRSEAMGETGTETAPSGGGTSQPPGAGGAPRQDGPGWAAAQVGSGGQKAFERHPPSHLTRRELQVLELIARGTSNKLIARELGLSPHTVKRHVAGVLDALQVKSRGQAAHWYAQHVN